MNVKRKRLMGLNIKNLTDGQSVNVVFQGYGEQKRTHVEAGDAETIPYARFQGEDEEFQLWLNAGLKNALSAVTVGMLIELVYLGKTEFTNKATGQIQMVNTYRVYELEESGDVA